MLIFSRLGKARNSTLTVYHFNWSIYLQATIKKQLTTNLYNICILEKVVARTCRFTNKALYL
jgi:hypothetical protein